MSVHEIFYNYPLISLTSSDILSDPSFNYISMPVINADTFVYTLDNNSTIAPARKLYLREIDSVTIPGFTTKGDQVLIIEQYNNTSEKYYTAFKLTVDSDNGTDKIDMLFNLKSGSPMELDLNEIITRPVSGTCNVYTDATPAKKSLFVFADVDIKVDIKIKAQLKGLKKVSASDAFYIATPTTSTEIQVVNEPDKIEVECTPIYSSGDDTATLYGYTEADIMNYSTLHSTTLFYFFAFTMTILSFLIPPLYKYFVVDYINYWVKKDAPGFGDKTTNKDKGVYLHTWNIALTVINTLIVGALIGTMLADRQGLTVGLFYLIVFIFSFSLLYMKTSDKTFLTTTIVGEDDDVEIKYDTSYEIKYAVDTDENDKQNDVVKVLKYILFGGFTLTDSAPWVVSILLSGLMGGFGVINVPFYVLLSFISFTIVRLGIHNYVIKDFRKVFEQSN